MLAMHKAQTKLKRNTLEFTAGIFCLINDQLVELRFELWFAWVESFRCEVHGGSQHVIEGSWKVDNMLFEAWLKRTET